MVKQTQQTQSQQTPPWSSITAAAFLEVDAGFPFKEKHFAVLPRMNVRKKLSPVYWGTTKLEKHFLGGHNIVGFLSFLPLYTVNLLHDRHTCYHFLEEEQEEDQRCAGKRIGMVRNYRILSKICTKPMNSCSPGSSLLGSRAEHLFEFVIC